MEEQRTLVRSSDPAERLAAALLIPGLLRERLRELGERLVLALGEAGSQRAVPRTLRTFTSS